MRTFSSRGATPYSSEKVVVLPAPLGPRRPKSSPDSMSKLTPLTASTSLRVRRITPVWVRQVLLRSRASMARVTSAG